MQSIGERLEEARKRKGISIREAAEATKIRSDYLHKFESNQFDINLPEIYVRGFLRSYANFLKLPADKIIADYNALSHIETKSNRQVNREVYGRMDISTNKEPKTSESGGSSTTPSTAAEQEVAADSPAAQSRNPATFVPPQHSGGSPVDKKLLLKAAILVMVTVIVIILIVIGVSHCSSGGTTPQGGQQPGATQSQPGNRTSTPQETWIRPQANERSFSIVAKTFPVKVIVVTSDDAVKAGAPKVVYYDGIIPAGGTRQLPRVSNLFVGVSSYKDVYLNFDGAEYPLTQDSIIDQAPVHR